jgi:hypothetical protein
MITENGIYEIRAVQSAQTYCQCKAYVKNVCKMYTFLQII